MKTIQSNHMEDIIGGGQGRTCMILGGIVFGLVLGGFFNPGLWGSAATITGGAAIYGCFN